MATIERSIEEMIEDTEPVEEPVEVQKPKKARSQKQIESLAKAREARAKKLNFDIKGHVSALSPLNT